MTLSPSTLTLKIDLIAKNINIKNGEAPYTISIAPEGFVKKAGQYDDKNFFSVLAFKKGKTKITVTDAKGKTGVVEVTVE